MGENHFELEGRKSSERLDSLSSVKLDSQAFAAAVRAHCRIENRLHWVLDVVFRDDLSRLRTGSGPQNMAVVKHIAMNLVRNPNDKHSLKVRRKRANLDPDYLETLVTQRQRSEEHTSELQSLMRISYAVFCLKKKKNTEPTTQKNDKNAQK